jgi:hypothetical protein
MGKSSFLITLVAIIFLLSCKKDEETDTYNIKYTDETPELSKANVEQNAIDLIDQLDILTSSTAIKVLMNLNNLQTRTRVKSMTTNPILEALSLIISLSDNYNVPKVFERMKTTEELLAEDPLAFSSLFDSIAGKYTYNIESGEFDVSVLADSVVIEFPGIETDLTNTAVITIDFLSVTEITDPVEQWPEDLDTELPASFRIALKYNSASIAGAFFNASYKSNGLPIKVVMEIYVDDFTFNSTVTNSSITNISWSNTLKLKDDILFETYILAEGYLSLENNGNNIIDTVYTDDSGSWIYNEAHIDEIIKNANAHVILMNIEVLGQVNVIILGETLRVLDERREQLTEEEYFQAKADAINANAKPIVIYRDSNKKIAETEAYVESYNDEYNNETHYDLAMRFVYADNSKVDVETYVKTEMDNFYISINKFIGQLNTRYDLNIKDVGKVK